jgi:hypothetical protein
VVVGFATTAAAGADPVPPSLEGYATSVTNGSARQRDASALLEEGLFRPSTVVTVPQVTADLSHL